MFQDIIDLGFLNIQKTKIMEKGEVVVAVGGNGRKHQLIIGRSLRF